MQVKRWPEDSFMLADAATINFNPLLIYLFVCDEDLLLCGHFHEKAMPTNYGLGSLNTDIAGYQPHVQRCASHPRQHVPSFTRMWQLYPINAPMWTLP